METSDARIIRIDELLSEADRISKIKPKNTSSSVFIAPIPFISWLTDVTQFLFDYFDDKNAYVLMFQEGVMNDVDQYHPQLYHLSLGYEILRKLKIYLIKNPDYSKFSNSDPISQVEILCNRFHVVANQLRSRRESRKTILLEDEYDVQDLFHALLKIYFSDIRSEEWTPSYAGGSSRMDFLLKNEKIVIEIKKTRPNLKEKEIGEQLLVDIAKYGESNDCKILICFIYDPEARIRNHAGLETDLMKKSTDSLQIKAYIRPTGQ